MASMDLRTGMIFLLQVVVGTSGNISLLFHYIFLYWSRCRSRPSDLILRHLTVANSLVILSRGLPGAMTALGLENFLDDFASRFISYVYRVARGVSIGSTCLLSVFQAITISPMNSRWAKLKVKACKYTGFSMFLCWILHMLVNAIVPTFVTSNWSNMTITERKDYGSWSSIRHDRKADSLYAALLSFSDVVSLGLIIWASSSMVCILHRHKQRVQHIHGITTSSRSCPETRATQTILVLVSTFVSFYTLSSILQLYVALCHKPSRYLLNISGIITVSFPTVSPFLLMNRDSNLSRLCSVSTGMITQSHFLSKNTNCLCFIKYNY